MMAPGLGRLAGGVIFIDTVAVTNNANNINVQQGSLAKIGDILLNICANPTIASVNWSPSSSFTEILDPAAGADIEISYAVASVNGANTYGTAQTGATGGQKASLTASFRKAAYSLIGSGVNRSGTGALDLTGITMPSGGMLVALLGSSNGNGTHTPPAGMLLAGTAGGGSNPALSIYYQRIGAGATGNRSFTIGGTPGDTQGALVGLVRA